jgi:hypothetical protein
VVFLGNKGPSRSPAGRPPHAAVQARGAAGDVCFEGCDHVVFLRNKGRCPPWPRDGGGWGAAGDVCFVGCDVVVFLRNKGPPRSPAGRPPRAPPRAGANARFIKNEVIFSQEQRSLSLDRTGVRRQRHVITCPSMTLHLATRTARRRATLAPSCFWTSTSHLSIDDFALGNADCTQKGHHSTKLLLDKYFARLIIARVFCLVKSEPARDGAKVARACRQM